MGKLIHILRSLTLGAAVLPLLAGQPALAANPKAAVPAAAASAASAAPQAKATDSTPSRYAGNDIKAYVTALANQLAPASEIVPSCNIMGSSGVNAKRPMPMAVASAKPPARMMRRWSYWEGNDSGM